MLYARSFVLCEFKRTLRSETSAGADSRRSGAYRLHLHPCVMIELANVRIAARADPGAQFAPGFLSFLFLGALPDTINLTLYYRVS